MHLSTLLTSLIAAAGLAAAAPTRRDTYYGVSIEGKYSLPIFPSVLPSPYPPQTHLSKPSQPFPQTRKKRFFFYLTTPLSSNILSPRPNPHHLPGPG